MELENSWYKQYSSI